MCPDQPPPDDDHLDGCDHVIASEDYDDDATAELRVLFPQGTDTPDLEETAEVYRALGAVDA